MPGQEIVPPVGSSSPAIRLSSVDFPLPEAPKSAMRSPCPMEKDVGSSPTTVASPVPNVRERPSALTIGCVIDDPSVLKADDARGDPSQRLAVGRDHDGPSGRAMNAEQPHELLLRCGGDVGGRFVGENDARREGQSDRQPDPRRFAARQFGRQRAAPRRHPDLVEERGGAIPVWPAGQDHRQLHVLLGGEPGKEIARLHENPDGSAPPSGPLWFGSRAMRSLFSRTCPPSGTSSPARHHSSVDFPLPEGPTSATNSRASTAKLTPRSARVSSSRAW